MPPKQSRMIRTNRWWETFAFIIGVLNLSFHAGADTMRHLGYCLGDCTASPDGIPWSVVIISAVLIAPKMLGRSRATSLIGKGIDLIGLKLTGTGPARAVVTTPGNEGEPQTVMSAEIPDKAVSPEDRFSDDVDPPSRRNDPNPRGD